MCNGRGMDIGMIGGTGPAGLALATRLAASGVRVAVGSRSAERAVEVVTELQKLWPGRELPLDGVTNEDAASYDVVVLATPWDASVETVLALRAPLEGTVLVSMVSAIVKVGRERQAMLPALGSIAGMVQDALPATHVSTAFHHLPAKSLADLDGPVEGDVLVCANDTRAIEATVGLVEAVPGLRAVRCGSLVNAGPIEALTAVIVNVNIAHRSPVSIVLKGLGTHRSLVERA